MVKAIDCEADSQARAYAREQAIRKNSERLVLELLHAKDLGMVSKGYLCRVVYNLYADNDKLTRELFKAAPNHERFANITPEHRAILEGKD